MSIINDALKKVQNQLDKQEPGAPQPNPADTNTHNMENTNPPPPPPQKPPAETGKDMAQFIPQKEKTSTPKEPTTPMPTLKSAKKSPEIHWSQVLRSSLILIVLVSVTVYIYTTYTSKAISAQRYQIKSKPISISLPSAEDIKEIILPAAQTTAAAKPKRNGLVVSGIITSGARNAALINDQIYEVGDMLEGNEIVNITERTVEVRENGEIKTLHLER